jgi:hypothetical protein
MKSVPKRAGPSRAGRSGGSRATRSGVVRVAVVLGLAVPAVLVGAQAAMASVWTLGNPINPSGSIGSDLADVSCASSTYCVAIGSYEFDVGGVGNFATFAEAWNGSSWSMQTVPNADNTNLNSVWCVSATSCIAVGDQLTGVSDETSSLAEVWNGSTWTTETTPNPSGGTRDFLLSVDCTSATRCMSVGSYYTSKGHEYLYSETLNGSTWTMHSTPHPAGSNSNQFSGVSCPSITDCVAVGDYLTPSYTGLAEYWNGSKWTIEATPLSSGESGAYFGGVSCMSATSCFAAGDDTDANLGNRIHTLSEFWNGSTWAEVTTPAYTKEHATLLSGVSCVPGYCTSVGSDMQSGPVSKTLAEHWKQTFWEVQTTQNPSGNTRANLSAVSCWSDDGCVAVGFWENSSGTSFVLAEQAT